MNKDPQGIMQLAKITFVRTSIAFISSMLCLPNALAVNASVIDLTRLYRETDGLDKQDGSRTDDGNFCQMTDGTVLFFNPKIRSLLRRVVSVPSFSFNRPFQIYSPGTGSSEIRDLRVENHGGSLKVGSYTAKTSELDRLGLSFDLFAVKAYLNSIHPNNFGIGISCSSIVRLHGSKFLVTGGDNLRSPESETIPRTAIIYDVAKKQVLKKFLLQTSYAMHQSLILRNGNVLLVGRFHGSSPVFELVDPRKGTSKLLQSRPPSGDITGCLDSGDNCLIFGGNDSKLTDVADVSKLLIAKDSLTPLPKLKFARSYAHNTDLCVRQNAIMIDSKHALISAGVVRGFYGWRPVLQAEVYSTTNETK